MSHDVANAVREAEQAYQRTTRQNALILTGAVVACLGAGPFAPACHAAAIGTFIAAEADAINTLREDIEEAHADHDPYN